MAPILLLLIPFAVLAQSKASFFPKYLEGQVIEERIFEDKIERNLERNAFNYRYVVNYTKLSKIPFAVAYPIHALSQYSTCSSFALIPLQVNAQNESIYYETSFKCIDYPEGFDLIKYKNALKDKYCSDPVINSKAQLQVCKELGFK